MSQFEIKNKIKNWIHERKDRENKNQFINENKQKKIRGMFAVIGMGLMTLLSPISTQAQYNVNEQYEKETQKEKNSEKTIEEKRIQILESVLYDNNVGNAGKEKKEEDRVHIGDVIMADENSILYDSSSMEESLASGVFGKGEIRGVNKIAVVHEGDIYSTDKYSETEIYDLSKKFNVPVSYHIDRMVSMNGKLCVETHAKNNPAPIYIYHDEKGVIRKSDGEKFQGSIISGLGWISEKDAVRVDLTEKQEMVLSENQKSEYLGKENEKEEHVRE